MTQTFFTRRAACAMLLLAVALAPACKGRKVNSRGTDEETPRMASVLNLGDPKAEPQLVTGFYDVEAGAWRWTAKQFTVTLKPPFGSRQKGAKLSVKLTAAAGDRKEQERLHRPATAGNATLAPETYTTPGDYFTSATCPPTLPTSDSVRVDSCWIEGDGAVGRGSRELGIIVLAIGLENK
jgi:hypothetical protein